MGLLWEFSLGAHEIVTERDVKLVGIGRPGGSGTSATEKKCMFYIKNRCPTTPGHSSFTVRETRGIRECMKRER